MSALRRYHAGGLGRAAGDGARTQGRRGMLFGEPEPAVREAVGDGTRARPRVGQAPLAPARVCRELSEFEVQRHYLHLSQETLGMMGVSLASAPAR